MAAKRPRSDDIPPSQAAYVAKLDSEQVVTFFGKSNEKLKSLEAQYAKEVSPKRAECLAIKSQLLEYMETHGHEWAMLAEDLYLQVTAKNSGPTICPRTFVKVMTSLKDDPALLGGIVANVESARLEAIEQYRAKNGETAELPVTPQPRFVGKGRSVPQRPLPPLGRPLSVSEMVAEVLFQAVYNVHRGRGKNKLEVLSAAKRGSKAKMVVVKNKDVCEAAAEYVAKFAAYKEVNAVMSAAKKVEATAMAACEDVLKEYLPTVNAQATVKRTLPTEEGLRTVTVALEDKPVKPNPMSLFEFSQLIDSVAKSLALVESSTSAEAIVATYDTVIESVVSAMNRRIEDGTVVKQVVTVRRSKLDTEEPEVEEAGEDSDDNMFDI